MNMNYAATMSDKKEIAELKADNKRLEAEMKRLDKMRVGDYKNLERKYKQSQDTINEAYTTTTKLLELLK